MNEQNKFLTLSTKHGILEELMLATALVISNERFNDKFKIEKVKDLHIKVLDELNSLKGKS